MPPVSKAVIDEMATLWPIIKPTDSDLIKPPKPGELDGDRRVVELGDQAALAMVWLYVKDASPPAVLPTDAPEIAQFKKQQAIWADGRNKEAILMELIYDPATIPWLLPILQARMGVFEDAVKSRQIEDVFSFPELDWVSTYLDMHGTDHDVERGDALNQKIREYYNSTNRPNARPPLAQRREEIDYNRQHARQMASLTFVEGYAGRIRSFAEVSKLMAEQQAKNKKTEHPDQTAIVAPASVPSPSTKASAPMSTKATTQSQPESPSWLVWLLVVIMATVAAVWVFLRKSK